MNHFGRPGVAAVFGVAEGSTGLATAPADGAQIVFKVTEVFEPAGAEQVLVRTRDGVYSFAHTATAPDVEAGMTILVTLNDGHIATQESSIPVGPAVLTVANAGQELHGLHVEGPGVKAALENPLDPNGSGTISVTFQDGEYVLYCPILDHREKGETLTITVPTG